MEDFWGDFWRIFGGFYMFFHTVVEVFWEDFRSFRGIFLGRIFLGRIFLGGIFFYDI